MKNDTEIDRVSNDLSEVGTDIQKAVFSEHGPIIIRIENVGDTSAYTQFSTLIYDNLEESKESTQEASSTTNTGVISGQSSPSSRLISLLILVYITYAIIASCSNSYTISQRCYLMIKDYEKLRSDARFKEILA